MIEGKKLGLVGRVVLGAGAVGGLVFNSGCDAVVGGYVGHKLAERGDGGREVVGNDDSMKGPVVPYDVDFLAYYRIKDLKTGEIEIVEGRYGFMMIDWVNGLKSKYKEKCPNGYKVELIEERKLIGQIESVQ